MSMSAFERHLGQWWLARRLRPWGASRRQQGGSDDMPLVVIGPLSMPSGIGQGARLMVRAAALSGRPVVPVDVSAWIDRRLAGDRRPPPALPAGDRVIHLNPPRFLKICRALGPQLARGGRVFAYWAWELDRAPGWWRNAARLADEIWVPSPFVRDALVAGLGTGCPPVRVVPHPVEHGDGPAATDPAERRAVREGLGIAPEAFVAGLSFSMLSGFRRKNPIGAIDAFRAAFPGRPGCRLVIRCPDPEWNAVDWRRLRLAAGNDGRIRLIEAGGEGLPMSRFYALIDVYLSLHRGEGFGLNLAESLRAGIPVVATAWSLPPQIAGHPGFRAVDSRVIDVTDPGGPYADCTGMRWADPDPADAARHLFELHRDTGAPPIPVESSRS